VPSAFKCCWTRHLDFLISIIIIKNGMFAAIQKGGFIVKQIISKLKFPLLTAFFILITACSSGGDSSSQTTPTTPTTTTTTFSGNTAPAAIDASNVEAIGKSAGEAVQKAAASTSLPTSIAISSSSPDMDQINNIVLSTARSINQPAGYDISSYVCESGTASSTYDYTTPVTSGPYDETITYNNCKYSGSNITVNGSVIIHFDDIGDLNAAYSITYNDFTVTDPVYGTTTINWSYSCTNLSDYYSCTYSSDFVGSDGVTSRITEYSIYGDPTGGYTGSATFYHGTYGEVSLTITGITYGSCGALPDGGDIAFSSTTGSSGTIMFHSDCSVSGTWVSGTGSGSF
jgi:hypothetical protein